MLKRRAQRRNCTFWLVGILFCIAGGARAGTCPASVPSGITTCKYVDYAAGADTNNGDTEGAPWKHAPGMLGVNTSNVSTGDGCAGNCAAFAPAAGEGIILKGGTVWAYTALPWNFTWAGSGTTSAYGCTGSGCIYLGYDPTWNQGKVNSVTLTRDLGGCNPTSPPTVAFSGGGGSGAAATANVIPAAAGTLEPTVAGFVYHVTVTNQGSGYTSNPTVTISGGGCTGITAVADIQRPVIDAGGKADLSGYTWQVGSTPNYNAGVYTPSLIINDYAVPQYLIVDHLEVRNIQQLGRDGGGGEGDCVTAPAGAQSAFIDDRSGGYNTIENNYTHGRFTNCTTTSSYSLNQEQDDAGINYTSTDDVGYNTMENGDSFFVGTSSKGAGVNFPEIFSESDMLGGGGHVHNNHEYSIRWMIHQGGTPSNPIIVNNNEMWLVLYDVGSAHENELYSLYTTGTMYQYNNIFHSAVSGASNQQQMGNGTTQYFFNNISWGLGNGTTNYGIDGQTGAGAGPNTFYFYNNTMVTSGARPCFDDNASTYAAGLTVWAQNNHCLTTANPSFDSGSSEGTYKNAAGSTTTATIQASSVNESTATAATEGYIVGSLFAPTAPSNSTVAFSTNANSFNFTSLCGSNANLAPLCSDVNGNARPSTGGWQAGAYQFSGGSIPSAPTGLTATVTR